MPQTKNKKDNPDPFDLAMVLRSTNALPDAHGLHETLSESLPDYTITAESEDGLIVVHVDDTAIIIGLIDAPYPAQELQYAIEETRLFPKAASTLKSHTCHLTIFISEFEGTVLGKALLLSLVTGAVCGQKGSLGVIWTVPTRLIDAGLFHEMMEASDDGLPLYLWFDYRIGTNKDGTRGGYTRGLSAFGFKEFEFRSTRMDAEEISEILIGFTNYLLENGDVIADGNTIGLSEEQKIKICFEPSKMEPGTTVYSLYD